MHIPFVTSGSYPVRTGNLVRPLVDGEPAFRRICQAVGAAHHSVWVTVTFIRSAFRMPDNYGSFFDVLDRASARGIDVRVIFWRPNPEATYVEEGQTFAGSAADRDMLRERGSRFRVRWDRAHGPYCQHQKSWVIDAGHASETAFVGGINLNPRAMVAPGHVGEGQFHDVYVEVTGPAATDVQHNFVQRWNEASERGIAGGTWGHNGDDDLRFPSRVSTAAGKSIVQIQRNVHADLYRDRHPAPGGEPYDIASGERAILDQYLSAIDAARRSIYIENQATPIEPVAARIELALQRGVDVVMLVPADPEKHVRMARRNPGRKAHFDRLASLGWHEQFALVGIAGPNADGGRSNVYVHAKLMLIDDVWATIGSCNLHTNSLLGHTEMNVSFWDPAVVRALRCELLAEHLGQDTALLDDRAALRAYRQIARENREKRDAGRVDWQGLAFSLDPAGYGE